MAKKIDFLENFSKISIFSHIFRSFLFIFKNIFFDRKFRGKFEFFCSKLEIFLLEKNFRSKLSKKFRQLVFSFFFLTLPPGSKDAEYRVLLETNHYFQKKRLTERKWSHTGAIFWCLAENRPLTTFLRARWAGEQWSRTLWVLLSF